MKTNRPSYYDHTKDETIEARKQGRTAAPSYIFFYPKRLRPTVNILWRMAYGANPPEIDGNAMHLNNGAYVNFRSSGDGFRVSFWNIWPDNSAPVEEWRRIHNQSLLPAMTPEEI